MEKIFVNILDESNEPWYNEYKLKLVINIIRLAAVGSTCSCEKKQLCE